METLVFDHNLDMFYLDDFNQTCLDVARTVGADQVEKFCRDFACRRYKKQGISLSISVGNLAEKEAEDDTRTLSCRSVPLTEDFFKNYSMVSPISRINGIQTSRIYQQPKNTKTQGQFYCSRRGIVQRNLMVKPAKVTIQTPMQLHKPTVEPFPRVKNMRHDTCDKVKPFVAFQIVKPEESKPSSVEYIPVETRNNYMNNNFLRPPDGLPMAPCSSLNNSEAEEEEEEEDEGREDEEEEEEEETGKESMKVNVDDEKEPSEVTEKELMLRKRKELADTYSQVKGISYRAQSAQYHRSQFHMNPKIKNSLPKPR